MRRHISAVLLTVGLWLGPTSASSARGSRSNVNSHGTFVTIDFPGALLTILADTSPTGDIVGRYCLEPSCVGDLSGPGWHGFLLRDGQFTSIDLPGAFHTNATGINAAGDIVGRYRDAVGGPFHGFLLRDGKFTTIDVPGAFSSRAYGITPDGDIIVGDYCTDSGCISPAAGNWHGFLLSGGGFTSFDFPYAVFTQVWRINPAGQIVGRYKGTNGRFHMFLLDHGDFTSIDFPGAINTGGDAGGINPHGDIVGSYCDIPGCRPADSGHGFLLRRGEFTAFDFPGAVVTIAHGINPRGDIVGNYMATSGDIHGYLLTKGGTEHHRVRFATIDFPGATKTVGRDITPNADSLVGEYDDAAGHHGFLLKSGAFTSIDVPGGVSTDAHGINARGDVVGVYLTPDRRSHGYLMNRDGLTSFDVENATGTSFMGINNRGDIVGGWCDGTVTPCPIGGEGHRGFLLIDGQFTSIDFPGASITQAWKINPRGDIVGAFIDTSGVIHGFLWSRGVFSSIDFPGAAGTVAFGINNQRDIVGGYCPALPCGAGPIIGWHGFLLTHGEFAPFDFPGAQFTQAFAINGRGDIAGTYRDFSNKSHAFLISKDADDEGEDDKD